MAARVQVIVEAKDSASGILRGITSQFGTFGQAIEEVTGKNIAWGNLAAKATELVVNGLKESVKATQEYAAEVRDLSLASGVGAEEASRLLQVLDDFEISAQDVTLATKALTKNGLEPSMETIAQLADQYVTLNTAQEKNEFIIKNLGRGGLQWANALSKGGDALRDLNDKVSANLILTDENINQTEEYRLALDSWNDTIAGLKVNIGTALIPSLTDLSAVVSGSIEGWTTFDDAIKDATDSAKKFNTPADKAATIMNKIGDWAADIVNSNLPSFMESGIAPTEGLSIKQQDLALAMKQVNDAAQESIVNYSSLISSIQSYQGEIDRYNSKNEDIQETETALLAERDALIAQMEQLTKQGYSPMSDAIQDVQGNLSEVDAKLAENQGKLAENEQAHRDWAANVILSFLQAKAAADGSISEMEGELLINAGVALGVFDQKTAEVMKSVNSSFDELDTSNAQATIDSLQAKLEALVNQDYTITVKTVYTSSGSPHVTGGVLSGGQASGGTVYAGNPYIVGEQGRERFVPEQNGRILGHAESLHAEGLGGGGGTNYFYGNVTLSIDEESAGGILGYR